MDIEIIKSTKLAAPALQLNFKEVIVDLTNIEAHELIRAMEHFIHINFRNCDDGKNCVGCAVTPRVDEYDEWLPTCYYCRRNPAHGISEYPDNYLRT